MSEPENSQQTSNPLPHSMRTRKPWPMWPIGLSIALFIGVYTWVNISYRKEGRGYEPFQAMMDRKNAIVEKNMYDWYGLTAKRAASGETPAAPFAEATSRAYEHVLEEIVPEQLKYYMPGKPILLPAFIKTSSPATLTPGQNLLLQLEVPAAFAGNDERLNLLSFYKEGDLYLLAALFVEKIEEIDPASFAGETASVVFSIPTDPIAAETINIHFLTDERLSRWQIQNLDPSAAVEEQASATEAKKEPTNTK